jgi:hypothetical protein
MEQILFKLMLRFNQPKVQQDLFAGVVANSNKVGKYAIGVVTLYAAYKLARIVASGRYSLDARNLVDSEDFGVLAEHLENDGFERLIAPAACTSIVVYTPPGVVASAAAWMGSVVNTAVDEVAIAAGMFSNKVFHVSNDTVELTHHRRIRKGRLSKARRCALSMAKARFGTPIRNAANQKAVHQFVYNILSKAGVQEGQMCTVIPSVVQLVFIPNRYEVEAHRMYSSFWSKWRRASVPHLPGC